MSGIKILGVGDLFIAKRLPLKKYEGFEEISTLIKEHDACFGNLETTVHNNEGYPSRFPGGGYAMASPCVLKDLGAYGFNVFSIANNHAMDYCHKGLEATIHHLDKAGQIYVGGGKNLVDASRPKYVECSNGRVAFIGVTSSFHDSDAAGPQGGIVSGRPGVNPLRRVEYYEVAEDNYQSLQKIADETGMNDGHKWAIKNGYREDCPELFLRELKFVKGEENRRITHPLPSDMERIVNSIKEASIQADYVVVSFHSHQMSGSGEKPADFIVEFCHACIDAGANVIFGHGAHELRGLELYKGFPIFYGLGDFIFHNEMVELLPKEFYEKVNQSAELYDYVGMGMNLRSNNGKRGLSSDVKAWESVMACVEFVDKKTVNIKIYPVSLGFEKGRTMRGWPFIDKTGRILHRFCELSNTNYGTQFEHQQDHVVVC